MSVLPAAQPPTAAELADPRVAKAWKAAQDFEATTLGQLFGPMFATVSPGDSFGGGGEAENTWRPMLTQELAKQMASHGGLGLAVPVFRQMLQMQETASAKPRLP